MTDESNESKVRVPWPDRILGVCYGIHGIAVGEFFFLVILVNSQGAGSAAEASQVLAAAVLQPVPMFVAGFALWCGWRWARLLALFLPVVIAICYLGRSAWPPGTVRPDVPPFFPFYFCVLQLKNIPGASVLALIAAGFLLRDAIIGRSATARS
jgi:hypothetical protein